MRPVAWRLTGGVEVRAEGTLVTVSWYCSDERSFNATDVEYIIAHINTLTLAPPDTWLDLHNYCLHTMVCLRRSDESPDDWQLQADTRINNNARSVSFSELQDALLRAAQASLSTDE